MADEPQVQKKLSRQIVKSMGGRGVLNRQVFISEAGGFIYFSTGYASEKRTTASLNIALAKANGQELTISTENDVNRRSSNPMVCVSDIGQDQFELMINDPEVINFSFVRDPLSNFVASYAATIANKNEPTKWRRKLFQELELDIQADLSVLELANLFATDLELRDNFTPWRSQRAQIAYDLVDYDFIGLHEDWQLDFEEISTHIFAHPIPRFEPKSELGLDLDFETPNFEITEEIRHNIEVAYAEDYEMIEEIVNAEYVLD